MLERMFATAGGMAMLDGLCTLIGSCIMQRQELNQQMNVVLAGGVIAGFTAGTLLSLPNVKINEDSSLALKLGIAAFDIAIVAGAMLMAPLVGERIANAGTQWEDVVTDSFIGAAVLGGSTAALIGGVYLVAKCSSSFFSKPETTESNAAAPVATPGSMV